MDEQRTRTGLCVIVINKHTFIDLTKERAASPLDIVYGNWAFFNDHFLTFDCLHRRDDRRRRSVYESQNDSVAHFRHQ